MKVVVTPSGKKNLSTAKEKDEQVYVFDPIDTLNSYLRLYHHLWAAFSENLESRYDISMNNFRVLMMVGQLGETASHEISDSTGMPVMAISRTVVELEKRELIERTVDRNNRRRKPIKLTPKGQDLFDHMMPTTRLVAKYIFDSLRLDEALMFDHCLGALIDHVTMVDEDGELVFVKKTRG